MIAIQDRLFPELTCFGCGPRNERGLQLKSYETDAGVVATFRPWPEHDNGLGYLNGGIISTVLDCHSAAAAIAEADRNGWTDGKGLSYVTAGLDVRFRRPAPLRETLALRAAIVSASDAEIVVDVAIDFDGTPRATATALWKRWRPR